MATLSLCILFFCLPALVLSLNADVTFEVPSGGPESYVFDSKGGGPYTGVNDGRVLKFDGSSFVDYAYASPLRTKENCDGNTDPTKQRACGRTIGLAMYHKKDLLYMLDAFNGLCAVGPEGGLAKPVSTGAAGKEFIFLDGIDVDQRTGIVYFTEASTIYDFEHMLDQVTNRDKTARILQYSPETKETTVLLTGLSGAGGIAVSADSTYLIITEFTGDIVRKYWLEGPLKGKDEILLSVKGPCNVKRTPAGDFWVAVNFQTPDPVPMGMRIDGNGAILEVVPIGTPFAGTFITEVHEVVDYLYVGSMIPNFGAIYKYREGSQKKGTDSKDEF